MVVSASMGVMNPLMAKLTTLVGYEYKKLKGLRKQVSFLRDELTTMNAFLEKMELMDDEELDSLAKDWRSRVREMAYDMEDCIDYFMHHLDHSDAGLIHKLARRLKTLRMRHRIANQIDELKARVIEANERRVRYKLDDCNKYGAACTEPIDPRITALYQNAAGSLVGIDGPSQELVQLLAVDRDTDQRLLKVVSVVGFGGLGKTTLAKHVYDKVGHQFDCMAFVSVSQTPDIIRLLISIQSKLHIVDPSQTSWDIISCAFPDNGKGSRVIVTTRLKDVAKLACGKGGHIYKIQPLNNEDSKKLFFDRVFQPEDSRVPQYEEISAGILKKCGGLPLAIVT
uniref:Rx N-terminal domain-containing protein n=1 Tax=Leersia perrieri TaxID=77586 RepID=A0A0D9WRA8_9ORYZ